jgi:hypothetical protein
MRTKLFGFRRARTRTARRTRIPAARALESRLLPAVSVLTYHNDLSRSGDNLNETQLTPANVNPSSFGQLFSYPVDGQIYGQPLIVPGVSIPGQGVHDVVIVTTEHDSVYAFDANSNAGPNAAPLWHDSFIDPANGITTVPSFETGSADITPEIGITATPAIDPATGTIYVVSKTEESRADGLHWVQKLHALDIGTGAEKLGGPVVLGDSTFNNGPDNGFTDTTPIFVPGTGDSSNGTTDFFNALRENERDGLFLSNNVLYLTFTSHGDTRPYHGWLVGFNPQTLQLESVYNTTPNGGLGAIWMGGGSPAVDANGNIYFSTGNGTFDAAMSGPTALGPAGGGLGYGPDTPGGGGGLNNSVAVKFDLFDNAGEGFNSTGLYTDGASPTVPAIDLTSSGVNLQNSDLMQATVTYDGTTLTETLTDTVTGASFNTSYTVNIPQTVGGNTAFVGFTGGTGGLSSLQDVQTWSYANGTSTTVDHSGGFASNADLTANGSATFTGGSAQLTDGNFFEAGSVFTNHPVDITNFSTTFTFLQQPGTFPMADGMTFCIENATPGPDHAMSVIKLSPTPGANNELPVQDYFSPSNEATLSGFDQDQGSGGVLLLPDQTSGPTHLLVQGGKEGSLFLINRDNMGGFSSTSNNVVQELPPGTIQGGSFDTPAYFNNGTQQLIYVMGSGDVLKSFTLSNGQLSTTPFAQTSQAFGFPGATPSISANGTQNGVVWAVDNFLNGTGGHPNSGPAVLHAYDATTLKELYSSSDLGPVDQLGNAVKFVVPTIANGKVYIGTQTGLYVLGLFPTPTSVPAKVSNLTATPTSATSVVLNWTNNATNARLITILRSTGGHKAPFVQIAELNLNTTTFTDTQLQPSTTYTYQVVPTNALGNAQAVQATATTLITASVLAVAGTGSSEVNLSWTPTANDHYTVLRSTDGIHFTPIARLAASQTTFEDTGLAPGVYAYEVQGFDVDGETATSNVVVDTVGEPLGVNDGSGFATAFDLTANGSAAFVSNPSTTAPVLQLTDGTNTFQASTVFTNSPADIRRFTTTFTFQMSGGTAPFGADGLAFVIQGNSPTVEGGAGGGLGYEGINNSVAIGFRAFAGPFLFVNGQFVPSSTTDLGENGFFISSTDLDPAGINFNLAAVNSPPDVYRATLTYDGTTLSETLTDISTGKTFSTSYVVDIPSMVGGPTAFVGLTGADGFFTLNQQVLTWTFSSPTQNLAPLGPANLQVSDVFAHDANRSDVTVTWTRHCFNEAGYQVFRSTDGVNFSLLATLPANSDTFIDSKVSPGTYFYRVLAFNANGSSPFSNVDSVVVGTPGQTLTVDHSAGFASHGDLTANGNASFPGTVAELTDGGFFERGSIFETTRVGVSNFTTTFTMRMHDGTTPMADGLTFVIQGASPQALGGFAFAMGYGNDDFGDAGIPNSVAIKFDNTNNFGEGSDTTGLFINGDTPTLPSNPAESNIDLSSSGINLQSQDVFRVTLSYDGTTLTETITDTATNATFTHAYTVNIPALVGGNVAYVGFTSGNGFLTELADVQTWTYQFQSPTGDEGNQLQRPGRDGARGAALVVPLSPGLARDMFFMRMFQQAGILGQLATSLPSPAPGPTLAAATAPSAAAMATEWLRAVDSYKSQGDGSGDGADALFATLSGRQAFLDVLKADLAVPPGKGG